jgi:hypothetical protein
MGSIASFVWRWVFFERGPELDRKILLSSKEHAEGKRNFSTTCNNTESPAAV